MDVHAALAYYFANREEMETDMAGQEEETARIETQVAGSSNLRR